MEDNKAMIYVLWEQWCVGKEAWSIQILPELWVIRNSLLVASFWLPV